MGATVIRLLRHKKKEGVSTWRVGKYVVKHFAKPENRREIENYRILRSLGIPTPRVMMHTRKTLVMEDLSIGAYRLATEEDLNDPAVGTLVAAWYRKLHENGRGYAQTHALYDESEDITPENLALIGEKTGAKDFPIWPALMERLPRIREIVLSLPRTLTYNDFYYTNFAVARDGSAALVFDYDLLGKGYVYADIRNVCSSLGEKAKAAFLAAYGPFDESGIAIDKIVSELVSLHAACGKEKFPQWGEEALGKLKGWGAEELML
ncbi:MAG: aminoglycoside phosphotransferase family protein [Firmicutes bacterium]|nr:aminoglycoside phosphotransferase family protein [Bacillota bacterium]